MGKTLVIVGTVMAAVAALLSLLLWGDDAAVDLALVLSLGFGGATAIGLGVLLPPRP